MTAGNIFSGTATAQHAGGFARWLPLAFVLVTLVTVVCVGFAWLHGPVLRAAPATATALLPAVRFDESYSGEIRTGANPTSSLAGSTPAPQTRVSDSPWEIARAEVLRVQRRIEEMLPATPGVTPDQYLDGSDDLTPVADDDQDEYLPPEN